MEWTSENVIYIITIILVILSSLGVKVGRDLIKSHKWMRVVNTLIKGMLPDSPGGIKLTREEQNELVMALDEVIGDSKILKVVKKFFGMI